MRICTLRARRFSAFRNAILMISDLSARLPARDVCSRSTSMQSRRIFHRQSGHRTGRRHRRVQRAGRQRPHSHRHHRRRATAARRSCARRWPARISNASARPISTPGAWKTSSSHRARRQDLPRLPPPAGRQEHRRGAHRHAAAPALRALRRPRSTPASTSTRKRPWRSRVEHAKRMRAAYQRAGQAHRADRPSVDCSSGQMRRCGQLPASPS